MTCAADISTPFPQACRTLPSIMNPKFLLKILIKTPVKKQPIPAMYSLLVGNRVIKKAVSGTTTPMAREYPLVTHCPMAVLTPK